MSYSVNVTEVKMLGNAYFHPALELDDPYPCQLPRANLYMINAEREEREVILYGQVFGIHQDFHG